MFILGKLCDASARYERAIQEEPNEIGHHKVTDCNVSSNLWDNWYWQKRFIAL